MKQSIHAFRLPPTRAALPLGAILLACTITTQAADRWWDGGTDDLAGNGNLAFFKPGSLRVEIIPEPSALLLGGLGMLALLHRRR
jgi:hypothetical protein